MQIVVTAIDAEGLTEPKGAVEIIVPVGSRVASEALALRGIMGNKRLDTVTRRTVACHFHRRGSFTYWMLHLIR